MCIDLDTRANQFCTNGLQMYVKHHYKAAYLNYISLVQCAEY
jgi:hypothetical protein